MDQGLGVAKQLDEAFSFGPAIFFASRSDSHGSL